MAAVVRQPVAAAINAEASEFRDYSGGVYNGPCSNVLNHDVAIVGYGQHPDGYAYWIAKNSWGPKWGDNGYIYLRKDIDAQPWGLCGLAIMPVYPVI
uniref:Uncharacterized protein n=1 Tax=Arundo donax TaxID=35708 RepID=A0A0A8XRC6_ARUDO